MGELLLGIRRVSSSPPWPSGAAVYLLRPLTPSGPP